MFMKGVYPEKTSEYSIDWRTDRDNSTQGLRWPSGQGEDPMQLPDEAITYQYQGLAGSAGEEWTPAAELRSRHLPGPGPPQGS